MVEPVLLTDVILPPATSTSTTAVTTHTSPAYLQVVLDRLDRATGKGTGSRPRREPRRRGGKLSVRRGRSDLETRGELIGGMVSEEAGYYPCGRTHRSVLHHLLLVLSPSSLLPMASREGRLVAALIRLADTLVSDFDVADLFHDLVASCTDLLDVAQSGLLLADGNGVLRVAAASNEATHVVELLGLENRGGPGSESFRTGRPVHSGSLAGSEARHRWPEFGEAARSVGFGAVTAVPMRYRDQVLGALDLFLTDADILTDEDLTVAQALADLGTIAILQDRSAIDDRTLISQLRTALETRVVIEQAKGIVAQEADLAMGEAFGRIRQYARSNNERLRDVSAAIVSGDLTPPHLTSGD